MIDVSMTKVRLMVGVVDGSGEDSRTIWRMDVRFLDNSRVTSGEVEAIVGGGEVADKLRKR